MKLSFIIVATTTVYVVAVQMIRRGRRQLVRADIVFEKKGTFGSCVYYIASGSSTFRAASPLFFSPPPPC